MMKFLLSLLPLAAAVKFHPSQTQVHKLQDITADSALGMKLLGKARNLEENNQNQQNGQYNGYNNYWNENWEENTWVAGYSIKFQGCHHISQWNDEADGEEDVRIATKRLVRFRLCPTAYCSAESAKGCDEGYGDYIIDMNTYLEAFFEAKQQYAEWNCAYLEENVCGYVCGENGGGYNNGGGNGQNGQYGGYYSEEQCYWDCYAEHGMAEMCMDENPYQNGNANYNANYEFEIEEYMECSQFDFDNDNNNGYQQQQQYDAYGEEIEYYMGPYCANQGGEIYLGLFTDESCTAFADSSGGRDMYYRMTGWEMPYGEANIVDMDCLACKEPDENNNDGNDNQDADEVAEVCETLYSYSGKCEENLPYGTVYAPNTNACNYMEGIKIVRKDGTVVTADAKANKTASIFIGIFVVAFVLLSAYVYYLKTKLDRASINLAE